MQISELQLVQIFAAALFCIGLYAAITRKNLILILIGVELMINAAIINLSIADYMNGKMQGQMMSIFAMVLSAASVASALAIIIKTYKQFQNINPDKINNLKN
ncbi:MAG: NADH-quinone oxidoreductase subunit NuoK [bacterium]|jgi:NADH:ubiquinone oxidoreductase subunit K